MPNITLQHVLAACKDLDGIAPAEIQVLPYGLTESPKGTFLLDEEAAQAVIADFDAWSNDMVIDYEHQTLSGGEAPAAGWIKKLVDKGKDGVWAAVEWTQKAAAYIAAKEYRYVSPVFLKRLSDNRVVSLFNVALTNEPAIDGMVPLINKLDSLTRLRLSPSPAGAGEGQKRSVVRDPNETTEVSMKKILAFLGLAETATEDQALDEVKKLKASTQVVANKAVLDALGLQEGAAEPEVTGTILAMKQSHEQSGGLAAVVKQLQEKLASRDANDLVAQAMKDGKITPAQEEWARQYATVNPEGFKVFIAKSPVVVVQGKTVAPEKSGNADGLDETQVQVNKILGIDAETFKKFNPPAA